MSKCKTPFILAALSLLPIFWAPTAHAQCTYGWKPTGGSLPGVDGTVSAITVYDDGTGPAVYVGGTFTVAGDTVIRNIAKWTALGWKPLGTRPIDGVDGGVSAMTVYHGELVVGGRFTSAGGVSAACLARWNGTSWSPLGDGVNTVSGSTQVRALCIYNDELIAAGSFSSVGGVSVNNIARWNGTTWSALGNGVSGGSAHLPRVYALAVYNSELIVGGYFTTAGSTTVNHIARWNGSSWSALGNGVASNSAYPPAVYALAVYNGQLIAAGIFTSAGAVSATNIAAWSGSTWAPLGSGLGSSSYDPAVALTVYHGQLIVGGAFNQAGGIYVMNLAGWNGTAWSPLGTTYVNGAAGSVMALAVFNDQLIVGGSFYRAGNVNARHIATWNGTTWSPLGDQPGHDLYGVILALASFNGDLIAGGSFLLDGPAFSTNITRWNGTSWSPLSGDLKSNLVTALTSYQGQLIAAGSMSIAGINTDVARWDGVSWSPLINQSGNGLNVGLAYALAVYGDNLIAAGPFELADQTPIGGIAQWNGLVWSPLGAGPNVGVDQSVDALVVYNGELIAGGMFTTAGGISTPNIAKWNGTTWSNLAGGVGLPGSSDYVAALAVYRGELIAAGQFTTAGGAAALNIAKWNGTAWSPLGPGIGSSSGSVTALAVYHDELYVAGQFNPLDASSPRYIARWDGAHWHSLGASPADDPNDAPLVLAVHGSDLIAGGSFTTVAGQVSNAWARWGPLGPFIAADFDQDCDVDADDLARFNACLTGPEVLYDPANLPANCRQTPDANHHIPADFDHDGDVDQTDFGKLQRCYAGPNISPPPDCLD